MSGLRRLNDLGERILVNSQARQYQLEAPPLFCINNMLQKPGKGLSESGETGGQPLIDYFESYLNTVNIIFV